MLFNSVEFLIFFVVVVTLYFSVPFRYRWALLLAASYFFYMAWNAKYAFLIATSTIITYWTGIKIGESKQKRLKKNYLILSLVLNLLILFTFKYFNLFNDTLNSILLYFNHPYNISGLNLLLPVGISFYTFQALSYSMDVYRGERKPERHLGVYALYVSFFPQLVAGPIERSTRLLPQFFEKHEFDYNRVTDGFRLILFGFYKKVVVADRLAIIVDPVYAAPHEYTGVHLILATIFFAFQIYCDFSGYSDIAIGSAKIMGYELMINFKQPYFSKSIAEFWRRWHISLSTWFRDYLYIPLGGNRVKINRLYANIMIVFIISGLWHGANWTFILWGALHGFYLVFATATHDMRGKILQHSPITKFPSIYKTMQVSITFSLVCFAWIFFRADSITSAIYIVQHLFDDVILFITHLNDIAYVRSVIGLFGIQQKEFIITIISVAILIGLEAFQQVGNVNEFLIKKPIYIRWAAYYSLCVSIILFGAFNTPQTFIYFQF